MAERVTFSTSDGVTIVGDWMAAPTTVGAVILLHAMSVNRRSWAPLQPILAKRGLASLSIDLRGHGESVQGPEESRIDFKSFGEGEHQSSLYDVIAAYEWLLRRGIDADHVTVGGASIGANLAVQMLGEEPRLRGGFLLSPGRNYHGLNSVSDAGAILSHQSVWIAASEGDDQEAFESSKETYDALFSERKMFLPLKNAGHGTNMFTSKPELMDRVADFLKEATQTV
ncbi:MAG: alpha/beta fold hydrolase [Patescibacteria group bacterium]|jgi:alpha-beta hydrolase superfamily lysophospholipase